jgi:protein TonB
VDASTRARFQPVYPPAALRAGITGTVIVQVTYDANGTVTDASVYKSSRNRDLDRSAVTAVRKWKINPNIKNGQATGGTALITVDFTL